MNYKNKFFSVGFLALSIGLSVNSNAQVSYTKQNVINSAGFDESLFLGGLNSARTSDTEVGDVNRDGFPDILDNNSRNFSNGTNLLIRMNNGDGTGFTVQSVQSAFELESFDSYLVDVNNDGYDDLIRSESFIGIDNRISVYLNERASPWFSLSSSDFELVTDSCVSNIEMADVNNDGFLDVGISQSTVFSCESSNIETGQANILLNDGTGQFNTTIPAIVAQQGVSTGDIFFLDANHDGNQDLVVVNENGSSFLYLNDGEVVPNFVVTDLTLPAGISGSVIDLNTDGLVDFVIGSGTGISVYLNNVVSPGAFSKVVDLPNLSIGNIFEMELADYDLDGDVDILSLNNFGGAPVLWANNGELLPEFTGITDPFPADFFLEGRTAEIIDFDLDGDNDIYIAGGEFTTFLGCFGCVFNQFYQTEALPQQLFTNFELDTGVWFQSTEDTDDWRFRWDRTSSLNTGPGRASSGTYYYYFETTVGAASDAGDTAILESPPLSFGSNRYLVFDYHMYGSDIGSLHVDVFNGVEWIESVWSVSGQQQLDETNPWLPARINLSEFDGEIKLRIRAVAIGSFRGDIAIDNLNVINEPFATLETIETDFIVNFPFIPFELGDLIATVDGESIFICSLSELPVTQQCEFTLTTAPGADVDLFVDVLIDLPEEFLPGLSVFWEGCDEVFEDFTCRVESNGFTQSLNHYQSLSF